MGITPTVPVVPATRGDRPPRACTRKPVPRVVGARGAVAVSAGGHSLRTSGLTGCIGGSVAALGYLHTGLIAAVPAATGLTALAASDITTRRFSLRTLGVASVLVSVGLLLDSGRASDWDRLLVAFVVTALAATALTAAWLGTKGIAFGDVLLTAFAVAVPAWVSPRAAGVTVLVGLLAAFVMVVVRRMRRDDHSGGVAFGPALLAGWVVAMVVS